MQKIYGVDLKMFGTLYQMCVCVCVRACVCARACTHVFIIYICELF
jgi:hypothetical protein